MMTYNFPVMRSSTQAECPDMGVQYCCHLPLAAIVYPPRTPLRLSLSLTLVVLCGCALSPSSRATAEDQA
ncbi:MAG: hypothetical protein OSA97_15395, partial [Nevskia sp.]|nr:hypothetical protein [Nevskia sp.]